MQNLQLFGAKLKVVKRLRSPLQRHRFGKVDLGLPFLTSTEITRFFLASKFITMTTVKTEKIMCEFRTKVLGGCGGGGG
jgi:hypothetical protein